MVKNQIDSDIVEDERDLLDEIEDPHGLYDNNPINEMPVEELDLKEIVKEEKAKIKTSNSGEVVFKDYLGLYGNTIIVSHGLGLASLYAHTSTQDVEVSEFIEKSQKIANTGATGAVFGDHLHFGILIQGVEVNPLEWMDKHWIKVRITDVLNNANKQIAGK